MSLQRPPDPPIVAVAAIGGAAGSLGVAAALACAGADPDRASLLVDLDGRSPRPTLIASVAARELEERLAAHLPGVRAAARGQLCHLAVAADRECLGAAAAVARPGPVVVHAPSTCLRALLDAEQAPTPVAVLLRVDLPHDRAQLALLADELIGRDVTVRVLKRRLGWIAERRALFGVLPVDSAAGLSGRLVCRLISPERIDAPA